MIEGIEVLNKIALTDTVTNETISNIFGVIFTIALFVFIIGFISIIITNADDFPFYMFIASFIIMIISGGVLSINEANSIEIPNGKYEYQVTVDDTVSMNEFNEKYEVIEVEGRIYTIREKENTNDNNTDVEN